VTREQALVAAVRAALAAHIAEWTQVSLARLDEAQARLNAHLDGLDCEELDAASEDTDTDQEGE